MTSLEIAEDQDQLDKIKVFRDGYFPIVQRMSEFVESIQNLMGSNILTSSERKILTEIRTEIDNNLSEIQNSCKIVSMEIGAEDLEREAMRDYHNLFSGDPEEHKVSFIVFLKSYILLKNLSIESSQGWTQIQYLLKNSEFHEKSEFLRQLVTYNIEPALALSNTIHLFCNRMKVILKMQREPENVRHLAGFAEYNADLNYKLSTIFTKNLDQYITQAFSQTAKDQSQLAEMREIDQPDFDGFVTENLETKQAPNSKPVNYKLSAAGQQLWNQTKDYYLHYDPRSVDRERSIFDQVIYFDSHMGADQKFIRTDLIRNITRNHSSSAKPDIEREYTKFLNNFFILVNEISCMNMDISPDLRQPFLYHLGPAAYYNLTLKFLQEVNTGSLHCKIKNGKMIRKFIPVELVRKIVLEYWSDNILKDVAFDINDYNIFRQIVKTVRKMHQLLMQKAEEEYQKLSENIRQSENRRTIFQKNASNWIGATNIVVFKRFLAAKK